MQLRTFLSSSENSNPVRASFFCHLTCHLTSMCRPRSLCQIKSKILCMYDTLIQKVQKYQIKKITKSTNIYIDFILEELDFKINKTDIEFFQLNCFMFIFFLRSVSKEQVVNLVKISFHEFIVMFQNIFATWDSI